MTGRDGRPAHDLGLADFEVFEDGKPVTLEFFRRAGADSPPSIGAPARPDHPSAVNMSNSQPAAGRVLALVLDANEIGFRPRLASRTREFANLIVDGLSPDDQAAVITLGGQTAQQSDFTSDRAQLKAAISRFRPTGSESLGETKAEQFEKVTYAHRAMESVGHLVDALSGVNDRRKGIVLVSGGIPFDVVEGPFDRGYPQELRSVVVKLVERARQSNVPLYTFYPGELRAPISPGQRSLEWLSEQTGGLAAVNTNTIKPEVARLLDDTGKYYLLGYYSAAPIDGKFHTIDVRVKRPGVRVRAREGFFSRAAVTSTSLAAATRAPLPVSALPLRVVGVPVPAAGEPWAGVVVGIELRREPGVEFQALEALVLATDMRGEVKAEDRLRIHNDPSAIGDATGRIRFASHLRLRPGRYMLRVAVRRLPDGLIGSIFAQVGVPSFDKRFAVSALSLTAGGLPQDQYPPERRGLLPTIPVPADAVSDGENLEAILKVVLSDARLDPTAAISFAVHLSDSQGKNLALEPPALGRAAAFMGPAGGLFRLPLPALPEGTYRLSVTAVLSSGAKQTRSLPLIVR